MRLSLTSSLFLSSVDPQCAKTIVVIYNFEVLTIKHGHASMADVVMVSDDDQNVLLVDGSDGGMMLF